METVVHRVIGIALALVFGAFALVQFNDPDPVTWVMIYAFMMGLMIIHVFRRLPVVVSLVPMVAAIIGAILLWPSEFMGIDKHMGSHINVELARESLGLLICAVAAAYTGIRSYQRRKRPLRN